MSEIRWIVMKFGGTSVSTAPNWKFIADTVAAAMRGGQRVLVVHSALAGISNRLEAIASRVADVDIPASLEAIESVHHSLARELGVNAESLLGRDFAELRQVATGVQLLGEASPRVHARLMALGELMATRLGAAYLAKAGLPAVWVDARDHLRTTPVRNVSEASLFLSAQCAFDPEPALAGALEACGALLITQGFIASNAAGETVILGRGGSDTSASYFGAKLSAARVEIWTDVPGMFSADPRVVPDARLLEHLDYDEAQEIATTGAKVLHPRAIAPARAQKIPLWILCTGRPGLPGTVIGPVAADVPQVKAVSVKKGITLVSMDTIGMWQQVGFLADAFECFKRRGLSIDLVSTSETNVTVTLDPTANSITPGVLEGLAADLSPLCRSSVVTGCAAVSLVGRRIRSILPRLGPALEIFSELRLHLVSQAASDLNLSFVVDEDDAERLARDLHHLLIGRRESVFGPTWRELSESAPRQAAAPEPWWLRRRAELVAIARDASPRYVYDGPSLDQAAARVRGIEGIDRVLFAMKANPHAGILKRFERAGLGFECVSPGEVERLFELFPDIDLSRILFTPNFAPRSEYAWALERGIRVTLDNLHPLREWPELFREKRLFVRVDLGKGRGHHMHVRTAGQLSKFGVPLAELGEVAMLGERAGATIEGLHSHAGSGIMSPDAWVDAAARLADLAARFPEARVIDIGGGLGVPDAHDGAELDLDAIGRGIAGLRSAWPKLELWIEPGRYLVARAGVLLVTVTQLKGKGDMLYAGVDTGMNSLIRPALYGAWHEIVNLSRAGEEADASVTVVGPICESGDVLGSERAMPAPREGDVLLIANAGAYGRAMSSSYNLREPAAELMIE
ncbi:MAG: bifunctional aspartate kinase/diaminopimelate decarboxylase [Thermoanaerobaculia bacterium]|nr:bifunctional aspartate kinase/diaminopimelate decarboxylase [Thermoanaerobaculia bacterium]